jgi:tRNA(Ile)-lysidine synthase
LFQSFQQTVAAAALLRRGERVIAGVSGGPDSVALLHLLCASGYRPVAAHFNHRLRGADGDRDEKFVHDLAFKWGLDFEGARADTRADARLSGESIEEAARRLRYQFFADIAGERRIKKVLVAHTQNDQAETLLFRLLRGAGRRGLGGMRMVAPIPARNSRAVVIRPLLRASRAEILQYLAQNRIPYRCDKSNLSDAFARNRIRTKLLPLIEKELQPAAVGVLARTAEILAEEDRLLEKKLLRFARGRRLNRKTLLKLPEALRGRAVARWLEAGGNRPPAWERLNAIVRAAAAGGEGKRVELPGGRIVRVENGALILE